MGESPSDKAPAPEVLKPQEEKATSTPEAGAAATGAPKVPMRPRRVTYRPSHKATFIGAGVVVLILAVNVGVITFFLRSQKDTGANVARETVTLSAETLDKLGVSRNPVGNEGTELTIGPDTKFNGSVTVTSGVNIGGDLKLNSKFSASDASLAKLQAGNTSLQDLNVNGDGTISTLNLRKDLAVTGISRLQGPVTISQLLTVNNNVNVAGSLAVGGTLSARSFQASNLVSDSTLTIGGHIITRGSAPSVSAGGALGSNGTVSISGNDASGTVAVNIGVGAVGGMLAQVSFRSQFSSTPHVVVTAIGRSMDLYVNRTSTGFSIYTNAALPPGGYAIDFIVMQ